MNVGVDILRAVVLHDPVDRWKVNAPRGDICGEEDSTFLFDKLEVDGCPFVLILLSMELKQILAELQRLEGLIRETYLFSRRKEYQTLRFRMTLEKTEESVKLVLDLQLHVIMQQLDRSN